MSLALGVACPWGLFTSVGSRFTSLWPWGNERGLTCRLGFVGVMPAAAQFDSFWGTCHPPPLPLLFPASHSPRQATLPGFKVEEDRKLVLLDLMFFQTLS